MSEQQSFEQTSNNHSIDEIQSHVLGIIVGLMNSYSLNTEQVQSRFEYVASLSEVTNQYEEIQQGCGQPSTNEVKQEVNHVGTQSWADMCHEDDNDQIRQHVLDSSNNTHLDHNPDVGESFRIGGNHIYVSTRREFCSAMSSGIKICPRYSSCQDEQCVNFHIENKNICSHNTRGSYCDNNECDLIVIRPCRKGKRCNDPECSFRHRN